MARNRATSEAVLLSGDEDIRVGVVLARQFGARVHLIGIAPSGADQSRSLMWEADTREELGNDEVRRFLIALAIPPVAPRTTDDGLEALIDEATREISEDAPRELVAKFAAGDKRLPREVDGVPLRLGRSHFGEQTLSGETRARPRAAFRRRIQNG